MRSFEAEDFDDEGNLKDGDLPTPGLGVGSQEGDDEGGDGGTPKPKKLATPSLRDARVPDDYEDEDLRGVDAQTLLQLLKTSKEVTKRAVEQANAATASAQSAAASAASVALGRDDRRDTSEDYLLTKEELLTGDPESINRKLDQLFQAKAAPLLGSIYQGFSAQAYQIAKADSSMPYWKDYEGEILGVARTLPVNQTASLDTWRRVYNHVLDQHRDEIFEKEINRRMEERNGGGAARAPGSPTLQPGRSSSMSIGERGSGSPSKDRPEDKLSDEQKRYARLLGVKLDEAAKYLIEE